ncbi:hypothetical protein KM043_010288 [Ampulex compressa]|nr:hypothetical protein KM043_010288 [Ampulex compressa]
MGTSGLHGDGWKEGTQCATGGRKFAISSRARHVPGPAFDWINEGPTRPRSLSLLGFFCPREICFGLVSTILQVSFPNTDPRGTSTAKFIATPSDFVAGQNQQKTSKEIALARGAPMATRVHIRTCVKRRTATLGPAVCVSVGGCTTRGKTAHIAAD